MPEEINRIVADSITNWFFVTEPSGLTHLRREGHPSKRVFHVGHVMVENVMYQGHKLRATPGMSFARQALKQRLGRYGVVTLHRPLNVDGPATRARIAAALKSVPAELPLVFPVHSRTRATIERIGIDLGTEIHLMAPQPYMSFLNLWNDAVAVLTDSGGWQEETTALGVPCVNLRESAERPIRTNKGTNTLPGTNANRVVALALEAARGAGKRGRRPALWDGHAAGRIVDLLADLLDSQHR